MVRRGRLSLAVVLALTSLTSAGCGSKGSAGSGGGGSGGGGDRPADQPAVFRDLTPHLDLVALSHLADVEHEGLYIDFGTPARAKYTVGNWRSGWLEDRTASNVTFTYVGTTGRVYFPVDRAGPLTLRFRVKGVGTRNMMMFLNGRALESVRFEEGAEFRDYDVRVSAEQVLVGENHLLLRFGGSTVIDGQDVSAAVDSLRVIPGETAPPASSFSAPAYGELTTEMRVGNDQRRALAVRAPTTLSFYVDVPRGGKLGFSVGADGEPAPRATAKVVVTPEGGAPSEVFSRAVTNRWQDQVVSLDRFVGQLVRVDFRVEGDGGAGRVGWATPGIFVPRVPPPAARPPAKNVIVLLIDTQRADRLTTYNPQTRVRTPELSEFAREATLFENAQAPENWTKPSVASVLTSLWPATHQAKTDAARVPAGAVLLSESYKEAGFSTASFIANGFVSNVFGFEQGWDHYTNFIRENKDTRAENVFKEAGDWVEAHKAERFFLYVQTIDPHVPYDPPTEYLNMYDEREYAGQVVPRNTADLLEKAKRNPPTITLDASDQRRLVGLYDGEVSYHDHWFGQFVDRLKALGVYDDTLFVITSDHGEEFNDHGSYGHGHTVYQELLHVPLMFRLPGRVPAGQRVSQTVSTVDIGPTVFEGTNIPPEATAEGHSLQPYLRGEVPAMPAVAFSDMLDDRRVIRSGRWKLVLRGVNPSFFDLQVDPTEQRDLGTTGRPVAMRYCRILLGQFLGAKNRLRWIEADQTVRGTNLQQENTAIDPVLQQQLGALGYAGGDVHGGAAAACSADEPCPNANQRCVDGHCVVPATN
jgi:arylsulfatase A-like enzyme